MLPERYTDRGILGQGSMGRVHEVYDRELRRHVAMKILSHTVVDVEELRTRFRDEALLMANLEHPNIVPVYDRGVLEDGRPWFTMRKVKGQEFKLYLEVFRRLEPDAGVALRRCVEILRSVSQGLAFAHKQEVIHRDVKPENVLQGSLGQVYLMDWGIARAHEILRELEETSEVVREGTQVGTAMGTVAYMAPEQASGRPKTHGPWSDVFGVGAMLYHVLTGEPPFVGDDALYRVRTGKIPDVTVTLKRSGQEAPGALVALCRRCMSLRGEQRPTAASVVAALVGWLDGQERTEEARRRVSIAREVLAEASAVRGRKVPTERALAAASERVKPWDPLEKKRAVRRLERTLEGLEQEALEAEIRAEHELQAALRTAPKLGEAHGVLSDLYQTLLLRAEQDSREQAALRYRRLLEVHGRPAHIEWLNSSARLTLHTDPPGVTVHAWRVEPGEFKHEEIYWKALGQTPLEEEALPPGNYMLVLELPGHHKTRYPVTVGRGEHWHGRPPGWDRPYPVPLPPHGTLADDERYVPAGWFMSGTNGPSADPLPPRRLWIDGFIASSHPVTFEEYVTFLNELSRADRLDEALGFCPTQPESTGSLPRPTILHTRRGFEVQGGPRDRAHFPAVLLDVDGCEAYLSWYAARTGLSYRLLHEFEWEKGARGTDRRPFPWGKRMEPTFTNMIDSSAGPAAPWSTLSDTDDISPYRLQGMGGNVRDWCANHYLKAPPPDGSRVDCAAETSGTHRACRGGAFNSSAIFCSAASRFGNRTHRRYTLVGFRRARSWGARPEPT